jgi:hypothetical protein
MFRGGAFNDNHHLFICLHAVGCHQLSAPGSSWTMPSLNQEDVLMRGASLMCLRFLDQATASVASTFATTGVRYLTAVYWQLSLL